MKGILPSWTNMFSDWLKLHNFIDQLKMLEYWAVRTLPGWPPGCWKGSIGSIHRDRFLWSLHWVSLGGGFQSLYFRRNLTVAYFFQIGLVQPPTISTMTAGLSTLVFLWSTTFAGPFGSIGKWVGPTFFETTTEVQNLDGFFVIRGFFQSLG